MVELGIRRSVFEEVIESGEEVEEFNELAEYRKGGEGFGKWCDDKVCVPIYPEGQDIPIFYPMCDLPSTLNPKTGKSYKHIWDQQKEICLEALRMEDNRFIYRQIVLCWMRGEGKSLLACLIQLWKFFNWPRQMIMLGANSKDQVKFVHYDIMRELIQNSPRLLMEVGRKNIQEKEIRIRDEHNVVRSLVRSISSFSGIVSNITGYTFSEIFDMKNPKFYVQLDGSIRNIPNAFGVIDSTVSSKTHLLYKLYINALKGKTRTVFFSYRYSKNANPDDYWNPNMDADQLNDYAAKFPFGEFERYFMNLWSAGVQQVFTPTMIEEMHYLGCDGESLNHVKMNSLLERKSHLMEVMSDTQGKGFSDGAVKTAGEIDVIMKRFEPITTVYNLSNYFNNPEMATWEHLDALGRKFDTDWAIMAGVDFGDPYATRGLARTIFTIMAKGLPRSKTMPSLGMAVDGTAPKYLYFLLHLASVKDHSLDTVKYMLEAAASEFDGVDTFCSERYGAWNVADWCEERDIKFEPIFPTYDRQRDSFKELLLAAKEGRFKTPWISIPGSKEDDILEEEMGSFIHEPDEKWFGSPEKKEVHGIQDDCMFSIAWNMYGGRTLGVDDFRLRKGEISFGEMYQSDRNLLGKY
ncbi:MAG: hypothetical protein DRI97_11070 [Bacteroidetes bacterium]|nr:MAG: hypothetical protein DRQ42_02155 [Gammaproteobacteria bacterium]RLD54674.1 MAG: hypothetical protein DRI97_11070 [Bacteroidota bacterium]